MNFQSSHFWGRYAEFLTALYLRTSGYKVINRNYKSRLGEIDIIAIKNNNIYAIEVKYRSNLDYSSWPYQHQQQHRQNRQLQIFLTTHPFYQTFHVRLALALVSPLRMPKLIVYS
ncbi:MAG: YraN family protein [Alphaproteobacteria bacterium]|nr:YraN family protein [Alphaproteobacteria bacterium]